MNFFNKTINYLKVSYQELRKVNWPSQKEAFRYTLLVIGISIAFAILMGITDYLLSLGLEKIITR